MKLEASNCSWGSLRCPGLDFALTVPKRNLCRFQKKTEPLDTMGMVYPFLPECFWQRPKRWAPACHSHESLPCRGCSPTPTRMPQLCGEGCGSSAQGLCGQCRLEWSFFFVCLKHWAFPKIQWFSLNLPFWECTILEQTWVSFVGISNFRNPQVSSDLFVSFVNSCYF